MAVRQNPPVAMLTGSMEKAMLEAREVRSDIFRSNSRSNTTLVPLSTATSMIVSPPMISAGANFPDFARMPVTSSDLLPAAAAAVPRANPIPATAADTPKVVPYSCQPAST